VNRVITHGFPSISKRPNAIAKRMYKNDQTMGKTIGGGVIEGWMHLYHGERVDL
jgi:hypothetical protein